MDEYQFLLLVLFVGVGTIFSDVAWCIGVWLDKPDPTSAGHPDGL